ncbi:MAG: PEP-CTERM sorting domain-containing protein [Planctomycetota bacterium]
MLPDITVVNLQGGYDATTQQFRLDGRAVELVRGSKDRYRLFSTDSYSESASFTLTATIDNSGNLFDGQFSVVGRSIENLSQVGTLLSGSFSELTSSLTATRLFAEFDGRANGGFLQSDFGPFELKLNGDVSSAGGSFGINNSATWNSFSMGASAPGSGNVTSVVPEPGTAMLFGMTLLVATLRRRSRVHRMTGS